MSKLYHQNFSEKKIRKGTILKLLLFVILQLTIYDGHAQSKAIVGVITDEMKQPIPGASVLIKRINKSTQTDAEGRFKIDALATDILEISYIGYNTQSTTVGNRTTINLSLKPSTTNLSDVVVVGYGTVKRSDVTGAVGSVVMKDFEKAPVKSFDQALAGRVAGVRVSTGDGQPGNTADIIIRGAGSISQDNSPLYVVDGFPSESSQANSINPNDIESIDILKDASATAIYGARGSNGVVLITTKRGTAGKPVITYNAFYGLTSAPEQMKVLDGYEYLKLGLERLATSGVRLQQFNATYFPNGATLDSYRDAPAINWQDQIYQTGTNQNHNVAVRGGADKTNYSVSLNYNNQDGVIKYTGFKRYQGRIVLDQKFTDKIKLGVNSNYSYTETYGLPVNVTNFYASAGFLYSVWGYRPVAPFGSNVDNLLSLFYDPDNENNGQDYRVNPVANLANQQTSSKNLSSQTDAYLEYKIIPSLTLKISGGYNQIGIKTEIFNNSLTQSGSKFNSSGVNGSIGTNNNVSFLNDNVLTYKKTFNKSHNLTALVGYSTQSTKTSFYSLAARQIADETLGLDALDMVPATNTTIVSLSSRNRLQSFLGRVNYDYKGKYLLTASYRADGSSKFHPGNRWGYFPSASAAWKFSQEDFMKSASWLSEGKLRVGYGESGNNRVGDFAYLSQGNSTNINYWYSYNNSATNPGFLITGLANSELQWETNKQTNIGLDLSLFKKRIDLTVDAYSRLTDNLILNAQLPLAFGIPSALGFKNIGSLQNRGLEFSLTTRNIVGKNFNWSSSFNISFNRNKIVRLTEGTNALLAGSGTFFDTTYSSLSPYISVKGGSVGNMYGLIFDGIYQYSDFDLQSNGTYSLKSTVPTNGGTRSTIQPGDIKYKDLNGDNVISADDFTIIGRGLPIHTGGFSNNFTYKNWDLNVFFQWSYGNNIINANKYIFEGGVTTNLSLNQFASYADRWTPTNPSNEYFRVGGFGPAYYSSRVVEDGSYLRLKTIQLGYNFSNGLLKKLNISKLNVNFSAQNLLTFTKYSGLDPEASARPGNLTPGFDYGTYPQSRTVTFGLNASF